MVTISYEHKDERSASVLCVELTAGEFQNVKDALEWYAHNYNALSLKHRLEVFKLAVACSDDWNKFLDARQVWRKLR